MSARTARLVAVAIGGLLALAVGGAVIAYDKAAQTDLDRKRDKVRTDAEIARIARQVFRMETADQRRTRIQGASIEAIRACARSTECTALGRQVFGPSRARLLAHARRAWLNHAPATGAAAAQAHQAPAGVRAPTRTTRPPRRGGRDRRTRASRAGRAARRPRPRSERRRHRRRPLRPIPGPRTPALPLNHRT